MQAKPRMMRCDTEMLLEETVRVVMSPSVRPKKMKRYCFTCLSGRSPDLRFHGLNAFPVSQWHVAQTKPLTVAGAVTGSALVGWSSPCSLLCFWPTGVEAPND
jgi:hypothetical protein